MNQFYAGFKNGMKNFGTTISIIVNSILLLLVYLIGVGLTFLFSKIFRKKFLETKPENVKTYWKDLNLKNQKKEECYRQF
ncbi:hypothetical protein FJZ19_01010 [Candidatus Pacearchaeota archaeon]|nr:hypothetical protein [Candidatus Pacearchaeota archaeon]